MMVRNPAEVLTEERMKDILSANLDRWMRKRGIFPSELARLSGLSKGRVFTYTSKKSLPNEDAIACLAKALDVGVEDLLPSVSRSELRAVVAKSAAEVASHSITAVPGRPGFSLLQVEQVVPSAIASQILQLLLQTENAAPRDDDADKAANDG